MNTLKNAALYKCKSCGRGGPNDLDANVRRFKIDPARPTYREARCAEHAPGTVEGVRRRDVTGVREATSTDRLGEALRSITADEVTFLQGAARAKCARDRLGSANVDDAYDAMLDRFADLLARQDAGKSREDALYAATRSHVNLPDAPVDAELPGTRTVSLSLAGFGDGLREDVLERIDPADAACLRAWTAMAGTVPASSSDPTAWREGRFVDSYAPSTDMVRDAALAYLAERAHVDAMAG